MPELIEKIEALGKLQTMYIQIECACGDGNPVAKGVRKAYKAIERMPTIEPKRGEWIETEPDEDDRKMLTMAELKPCPFCGGTNIIYTDKSMEKPNNHSVFCDDCGCGTGFFSGSSPDCILKQCAINAWNRRAENG